VIALDNRTSAEDVFASDRPLPVRPILPRGSTTTSPVPGPRIEIRIAFVASNRFAVRRSAQPVRSLPNLLLNLIFSGVIVLVQLLTNYNSSDVVGFSEVILLGTLEFRKIENCGSLPVARFPMQVVDSYQRGGSASSQLPVPHLNDEQ